MPFEVIIAVIAVAFISGWIGIFRRNNTFRQPLASDSQKKFKKLVANSIITKEKRLRRLETT